MFEFFKFNKLPEERFENTSNPSIYTQRFKELAIKSFYINNDRLFYIKKNNSVRYDDGNFEDINPLCSLNRA